VGKALMDKPYTACAKNNYGYGWQIDSLYGHRVLSHGGAISGFGSNFARIQEDDICIVVLSNKAGSTGETMHITNKLLAILYNQPYSIPVKRTKLAIHDNELQQWLGTYEIAEMHLTITVSISNGVFIAQPSRDGQPGPTSVMLYMGNSRFYDQRDEEVEVSFDKDNSGKIKGMVILQMGIEKYAAKIK
jgi:hypothetical protein